MQLQVQRSPAMLAAYAARPDRYDELCQRIGPAVVVRPHWREFYRGLAAMAPAEVAARRAALRRQIHDNGITYNVYADPRGFERPWELDLLPFILPAAEWAQIEAAMIQRATLFNLILADLYGDQTLLQQGLIPPALIYGHNGFLRALVGARPPRDLFLHLYAADLARSPDGRWWVVADRTQSPSGAGYALENRGVVGRVLPELYRATGVRPLVPFFEAFRDNLASLAPPGALGDGEAPLVVLLTPGPYNETYFEHAFLARELGFPLVEGQDLTVREDKVFLRTLDGLQRVHVILRRVDDSWCDPLELRDDSTLGVAGLVAAVRAGTVTVTNALGSGILETGALLGYLPRLAEHLLGQKLKMPSVATWWCGEAAACEYALEHLRDLVVKPAYPVGSRLPVFCQDLPQAQLEALAARIAARPFDFVAQEMVNLSQAPVLDGGMAAGAAGPAGPAGGSLMARTVALRVFVAATPDGYRVMAGGLSRVATEADRRIVSMQSGGGSKDVWVVHADDRPEPAARIVPGQLAPQGRELGLSSRVAESFFWLGRYGERADTAARLGREALVQLVAPGSGAGSPADAAPTVAALLGLCRGVGIEAAGKADDSGPEALAAALFDPDCGGSVAANLRQVLRLATQVRDRLSPDSWRIYHRLAGFAAPPDVALTPAEALPRLDEALLSLVTLSGFVMESMPRDAAWRFLSIGRRIERMQFLAAAIGALLGTPGQGGLQALLAVTDAELRYRCRHARGLAPQPVAELVMLDGANPRALRYQLESLAEHVAALPDSATLAQPLVQQLDALLALAMDEGCVLPLDARHPAGKAAAARAAEQLHAVLDDIWLCGNSFAEALAQRYFTHLDARSRATASL